VIMKQSKGLTVFVRDECAKYSKPEEGCLADLTKRVDFSGDAERKRRNPQFCRTFGCI